MSRFVIREIHGDLVPNIAGGRGRTRRVDQIGVCVLDSAYCYLNVGEFGSEDFARRGRAKERLGHEGARRLARELCDRLNGEYD